MRGLFSWKGKTDEFIDSSRASRGDKDVGRLERPGEVGSTFSSTVLTQIALSTERVGGFFLGTFSVLVDEDKT